MKSQQYEYRVVERDQYESPVQIPDDWEEAGVIVGSPSKHMSTVVLRRIRNPDPYAQPPTVVARVRPAPATLRDPYGRSVARITDEGTHAVKVEIAYPKAAAADFSAWWVWAGAEIINAIQEAFVRHYAPSVGLPAGGEDGKSR